MVTDGRSLGWSLSGSIGQGLGRSEPQSRTASGRGLSYQSETVWVYWSETDWFYWS